MEKTGKSQAIRKDSTPKISKMSHDTPKISKKISRVITYGTFSCLHHGHIRLLKRAKALGDHLTVGLSTDEFNRKKGKNCLQTYEERKEVLEQVKCIDEIIPENDWNQKEETKDYDTFVMGDDWRGKFDQYNCTYLPRTQGISTTLLKEYGNISK